MTICLQNCRQNLPKPSKQREVVATLEITRNNTFMLLFVQKWEISTSFQKNRLQNLYLCGKRIATHLPSILPSEGIYIFCIVPPSEIRRNFFSFFEKSSEIRRKCILLFLNLPVQNLENKKNGYHHDSRPKTKNYEYEKKQN